MYENKFNIFSLRINIIKNIIILNKKMLLILIVENSFAYCIFDPAGLLLHLLYGLIQ